MRLSDLVPGLRAKIKNLDFHGDTHEKLVGMGFVPGEEVEIVQVAPFGDPIVCRVGQRNITLRKRDAENIEVEVLSEVVPLLIARDGIYEVVAMRGGRNFALRMRALGIEKGKRIRVSGGTYYIENRRIALGRGEAMKIWVRRIGNGPEKFDS
ncbi:ferrous iron transport protein A [Thermotoga sp. KOL6]|uniref:FeoA family protein n=1 Tax=Thermotoga sp. KOL6 TaxID=126741 RepID=UPI000C76CC96|nr:ferrous iron transport protein A [Thermotoga sp. KOL6]PLV58669.1 iron transporter FeoA [Thermotoga sp. KOL6]